MFHWASFGIIGAETCGNTTGGVWALAASAMSLASLASPSETSVSCTAFCSCALSMTSCARCTRFLASSKKSLQESTRSWIGGTDARTWAARRASCRGFESVDDSPNAEIAAFNLSISSTASAAAFSGGLLAWHKCGGAQTDCPWTDNPIHLHAQFTCPLMRASYTNIKVVTHGDGVRLGT